MSSSVFIPLRLLLRQRSSSAARRSASAGALHHFLRLKVLRLAVVAAAFCGGFLGAVAQIPADTALEVQQLVQTLAWRKIFLRSFSLMGLNHGCMTVCNDQITRACTNLLAESLEWEDIDAPSLDVEETMELGVALKTEARAHRELHLMGKHVPENEPVLLAREKRRPCKKMLDHACPVACIRRDSGNLPNQKGYIPEYEPGAFEPQFLERFKIRYAGKTWESMDFEAEFSVVNLVLDVVGKLLGFVMEKISGAGAAGGDGAKEL